MRKAGLYLVALCIGGVAASAFGRLVDQLFGPLNGIAVLAVVFGYFAVLVLTTAYVFSVLAVPKQRPSRVPDPT